MFLFVYFVFIELEIHRCDAEVNVMKNDVVDQKPILTLYTKYPCPLCDELVEELAPFMHRLHLEKVDITKPENRQYFKQYRYDIPVLHINGEFLCMHRLDSGLLDTKLNELQKQSTG